jgi:hypothetical protein
VSVAETLLVYVAIPLAVVLFFAALTLPGGRRRPRWKSGQAWEHEPVWFEPHPDSTGEHGEEHGSGSAALGGATAAGVLTSGEGSDTPAASAGPLGGARGTW